MNRPSKELVDRALDDTGLSAADPDEFTTYDVLAAEVRALREELQTVRMDAAQVVRENASLRGRLRGLERKWKLRGDELHDNVEYCASNEVEGMADDLHELLEPCVSSGPDTAPISAPDGQAEELVVLENPAKQRGKLL
jgi:hypothetical protein